METRMLTGDPTDLETAGKIIKDGGLVAFPTETVYGLGGDALCPEASKKIYAAKGRPSDNPLIVHICKSEDVREIVKSIPEKAEILMKAFWPGPLTLIFEKNEKVPPETTGGLNTVAIRFPSNVTAQKLIREGGGFIAAPSANVSGRPSPTRAEHVWQDLSGRIDAVIEGGDSVLGLESTIVDTTVDPPEILRPGFVTKEMLEAVLGEVRVDHAIIDPNSQTAPKAPGMKYRHYAPKADLIVVEGAPGSVCKEISSRVRKDHEKGMKIGVIAIHEADYQADQLIIIGADGNVSEAAGKLYGALRDMDETDVDRIYSEAVEETGIGAAMMNRMLKAAGHQIIEAR